jgi:transposase
VKRVVVKLMPSEEIYISFVVKDQDFSKFSSTNRVVAIDAGIKRLIVISDGY